MRILVVAGRHPFPPRRGDELRAIQCAASLASRHQVTLLVPEAPFAGTIPLDLPFRVETCSRRRLPLPAALLAALSDGLPLQNAFFSYPALARRLAELRPGMDLVVLQLVRLAAVLPAAEGTPLIADLVDSVSLNFRSRARRDRVWLAPLLAAEARRVARCEQRLLDRANQGLVVCDRDRLELERRLPPALSERLKTVPIAVSGYAVGSAESAAVDARDGNTLVFSGNFGYFVNRDALRWFLNRVWPGLRRERPGLRLVCAGSRAPKALRRELRRAGAELLDDPPELRAVLASATIALAPLQCGSGVPIKVLEAWSAGTPVVASRWGAAGVDGDGALEIADTPAEWIEVLGRLLDSPERRATLVTAARRRLSRRYSPEAVRKGFLESVDLAIDGGVKSFAAGSG
jgi:glycosyltransferase involved in cell wall biosynthesis